MKIAASLSTSIHVNTASAYSSKAMKVIPILCFDRGNYTSIELYKIHYSFFDAKIKLPSNINVLSKQCISKK